MPVIQMDEQQAHMRSNLPNPSLPSLDSPSPKPKSDFPREEPQPLVMELGSSEAILKRFIPVQSPLDNKLTDLSPQEQSWFDRLRGSLTNFLVMRGYDRHLLDHSSNSRLLRFTSEWLDDAGT